MGQPKQIGEIVPAVLGMLASGRPVRRQTDDWEIIWSRVVDDRVRAHSFCVRCEKGTLYVRVDSSTCAAELNLRRDELLGLVKKETGGRVRRLVFLL